MNQNSNSLGIFTESITHVGCPSCNAELDVSDFDVFEEISCPSCNEKFRVPGRLGDFILIEELGRGAMGCVYLAMDESLNRLVALKVIRKEFGEDPKMLETVQREAQAMATLNHRNIVQVYSFGRVKEQPYFVMELLQGERLDEMMADGGILTEIRALEIALDVANGLDAANQAGLTHGDIKPANILMNDLGVAKVVDFGLAKFMEPGAEIEVWGTPYYIAPEKARKKGEDSRSDQYSLGGTIFHSLAGQPPFDGENPTKVVVAALKEETPVLKEYNPNITDKTSAVILRMMDKNPNRRYPTYASLLSDLTLALAEAKRVEEERLLDEKRLKEKENKKVNPLIWIVMLVTLTVTSVIAFLVWKQTQTASGGEVIQYEGPKRELHEPFSRAEIRNIEQAVAAVNAKDYPETLKRLAVAKNLIPENHSAMAWLHFLEAGIYFYAQYPDEARSSLEKAATMDNPIFDTEKNPPEDPRILARYALGQLDDRDLERAVRRSEPYFVHLSELAKGYRQLVNNQANQSARHFRYYSERRITNLEWPNVLHPITPLLHLPLEKLISEEQQQEVLERKGLDMMAGLGIRTTEGYPFFKIANVKDNKVEAGKVKNPAWTETPIGMAAKLDAGSVLVNARGVQPGKGRAFSLAAQLSTPSSDARAGNQSDVLFHFGSFVDKGGKQPDAQSPVKGMVIELPPVTTNPPSLRVRIGDGKEEFLSQSLPSGQIKLGTTQVFSVSWDGYRPDGSTPRNLLSLFVDGFSAGSIDLSKSDFLNQIDSHMLSIGSGIGIKPETGWGGDKINVRSVYIFSGVTSETELKQFQAEVLNK
ncbi:MAG: serine/threonine-protein kinase [Kiritimatiellia bacterium]